MVPISVVGFVFPHCVPFFIIYLVVCCDSVSTGPGPRPLVSHIVNLLSRGMRLALRPLSEWLAMTWQSSSRSQRVSKILSFCHICKSPDRCGGMRTKNGSSWDSVRFVGRLDISGWQQIAYEMRPSRNRHRLAATNRNGSIQFSAAKSERKSMTSSMSC